jgi:23S rRNA (uracil1939-C5)-methyltransferase
VTTDPATTPPRPKRGDTVELVIDDWGDKGKGIARLGRMVVLTDRGLPGDRVRARIEGRRKRHYQATITDIIDPSPHRVEPRCTHFGLCGGCRLQDLDYEQQRRGKAEHMREQLRRVGKLDNPPEIPIIPCDPPWGYRNKMEFSFAGIPGSGLKLGLHPRNNYRDAFELTECHLTDERFAKVVVAIRRFLAGGNDAPHDPVKHTGFLRFVVVRLGINTGDLLVNIVTADHPWPRSEEFGAFLKENCPEVTTALWTVNATRANVAGGDIRTVYFGPGHLTERLGPFGFEIAPLGFFQTNTRQAERLFDQVVEWCEFTEDGEILDLYSGAGAISLYLSQRAARVTGVELHHGSVDAAERNAARNNVGNCEFIAADVEQYLRLRALDGAPFPPVVVDPPRAGLHPRAVKTLMAVGCPRIVYVSCNPAALARDLEMLSSHYRLSKIAAVDMFPHTPHAEAVALFERIETEN